MLRWIGGTLAQFRADVAVAGANRDQAQATMAVINARADRFSAGFPQVSLAHADRISDEFSHVSYERGRVRSMRSAALRVSVDVGGLDPDAQTPVVEVVVSIDPALIDEARAAELVGDFVTNLHSLESAGN